MTWQSGVFYPRKCQQFLRIRIKERRTKRNVKNNQGMFT